MHDPGNLSAKRPGRVQQASTSSTLLERVKRRDAEGWRRLMTLYRPLVVWWCHLKGVHAEAAEDVAQEVFKTVAARVADFSKGRQSGSFRSWLHRITDHKVGDYFRQRNKAPRAGGGSDAQACMENTPAPSSESSVDTGAADPGERVLLVRSALDLVRPHFAPRTWEAAWRVVVEGQRPADVADALGMSLSALYTAKSRVLGRLREELQGLLD